MNKEKTIENLKEELRVFAKNRDWDQFHSPKNLSMALIVEAAELVEQFQWLKQDESMNLPDKTVNKIAEEAADILIYLVRFCDIMGINLLDAAFSKLETNDKKYPVSLAKGSAKKYSQLKDSKSDEEI